MSLQQEVKQINEQEELKLYKAAYYDLEETVIMLEKLYSCYGEAWSAQDREETESLLKDMDQIIRKVWSFENEKRLSPWYKLSELAQNYFQLIAEQKVIEGNELNQVSAQDKNFEKYMALDELVRQKLIVTVEKYICLTADGQTVRQALLDREDVF